MGLLTREALLAKEKLEIVKVDLGDKNFVYVRQMTGHERDQFEQSLLKKKRDSKGTVIAQEVVTEEFRAKLAVLTICDKEGSPLLQKEDFMTLSNNMSAKKLEKIINKSQEINNISEEDKENLVKNSDAGQEDNSNSGFAEN